MTLGVINVCHAIRKAEKELAAHVRNTNKVRSLLGILNAFTTEMNIFKALSRRVVFRFPKGTIEDPVLADLIASNFSIPLDHDALASCDDKAIRASHSHLALTNHAMKDMLSRPAVRIPGFSCNPFGGSHTDVKGEKCLGNYSTIIRKIFSFLSSNAKTSSVALALGLSPTLAGVPHESACVYTKTPVPIAFIRCTIPGHICMIIHRNANNKRFFTHSGCVVILPAAALRNELRRAWESIDDLRVEEGAFRTLVKSKRAVIFFLGLEIVQNNPAVLPDAEVQPMLDGKIEVRVQNISRVLAPAKTKVKAIKNKTDGAAFGGIDGQGYFAVKSPALPPARLPLSAAPTGLSFWKQGIPRGEKSILFGVLDSEGRTRKNLTVFTEWGVICAPLSRRTKIPGEGSVINSWWPLVSGYAWRDGTRVWLLVYGTTSFSNPGYRMQPISFGLAGVLVPRQAMGAREHIHVSPQWEAYMHAPSKDTFRDLGYSVDVPRIDASNGDVKILFLPGGPGNAHIATSHVLRFMNQMNAVGTGVFLLKGDPRPVPCPVDYGVVSTLPDGRELRVVSSPFNGALFLRTSEEERPIPSTQKRQRVD